MITVEGLNHALRCGYDSASRHTLPERACPYANLLYRAAYCWAYHQRVVTESCFHIIRSTANRRAGKNLWDAKNFPSEKYAAPLIMCGAMSAYKKSPVAMLDNSHGVLGRL